VHTACTVSDET